MSNTRNYRDNSSIMAPADDSIPVTKSDTVADPNGPFRGFHMDAAGTLKVTLVNGNTRTFTSGAFAAGVIHGLPIAFVWSTGTGSQTIYGVV